MNGPELCVEPTAAALPLCRTTDACAEPLAELVGKFGIASIRAAVLGRALLDTRASWRISVDDGMPSATGETNPDGAFIAAREAGDFLREAVAGRTLVRRLSPRLWSFAWTVDAEHLVIVEVRYRDHRDALGDTDSALIRLLFLELSRTRPSDTDEQDSGRSELTWPQVDRRRGRDWRSHWRERAVPLVLSALSALVSCWLAFFALPAADQEQAARQAESARSKAMLDKTVIEHLSSALATGDLGDLQDELSGFHALGYFPRAVVLNDRQRVVASVGMGNEARIGAAAPVAPGGVSRSVPLTQAGDELGRLLFAERPAPSDALPMTTWRVLGAAGALAAIGAAFTLLLPMLKPRR